MFVKIIIKKKFYIKRQMNNQTLNSVESLTGQAKIQSLNAIYNRVTLLKSKNVSRRLIQRDNNDAIPNSRMQQIQSTIKGNSNNELNKSNQQMLNSRLMDQDKQTDNYATNFWPSKTLIKYRNQSQQSSKNKNFEFSMKNQDKINPNPFVTNKLQNKQSKTISVPSSYHNNRTFLLSDFKKSVPQPVPQINKIRNSYNLVKKTLSTHHKRPMTSNQGRQSISFRINDLSKSKMNKQFQLSMDKKRVNSTFSNNKFSHLSQIKQTSLSDMKQYQKESKKSLSSSRVSLLKGQNRAAVYKKQIQKFEILYQCLSKVLSSIKQGLFQVQKAVSQYAEFIQGKNVSFIDDFIQGRQIKLQKLIRTTRLHETLSICYLFLQIAQQKIQDHQSYLVNFIGHSLSNLLLLVRLYILKQGRKQFEKSQFQTALQRLQISSYGEELTSTSDILLRIQHNNQIITMIHKKLGRHNQKFQACIQNFLKYAERQKYSCSLCSHYIFEYLSMHIHQLEMLNISPTLQLAPQPYTPPAEKQYTLVIEPLGILQRNGKYRPYLNQFMKWASKNFDVILWSWQLPYVVAQIYQSLSPYLTSRLYRHHCRLENQIYVKDLSRLGRNLQKAVIIDFDKRIFQHHLENGIQCRWKGNQNDKNLLILSQILEEMITSGTNIKDTLVFYAQQILSIRGY